MTKCDHVATDIRTLMGNIDEYVIPENQKIIEYIWDMNIITTHTNNYENDFSWVAIGMLSEENEKIFWENVNNSALVEEKCFPKFQVFRGISVPIIPGTKDTFDAFKPLFDMLEFQDVQKDGYMTIDEFYIYCTDCWKIVDNPDYHPLPKPNLEDYISQQAFGKAYDRYVESLCVRRRIKVVDEEKITKPLEEYLEETGYSDCYDADEGKIFHTRRLYEGHMRYKEEAKKHQ